MKTVQITLRVPKLRTKQEAEEFASAVVDHLMGTFNDDDSIRECQYTTIPNRKPPSYKTLVAELGNAIAEWSYLFPEKFDDDRHETQSRKNLARATRIYRQALKVVLDQDRREEDPQ